MNNCVTFYLMGEKGLASIQSVIQSSMSHMIEMVVVSHDYNIQNDYYNEIVDECKKNGLAVFDRTENPCPQSQYCITIAWRWLIPMREDVTLIVLHDSILPRYRGFAPLVNMLKNREPEIGVTALVADKQYDTGGIIFQEKMPISYPIRIKDAIDKLTPLYSSLVLKILRVLSEKKNIVTTLQDNQLATYSLWLDEDDYKIDWRDSANDILQFIYSVGYPYNGATAITSSGEKYKVFDAQVIDDVIVENRVSGKVIFMEEDCPCVVCGKGILKITSMTTLDGRCALPLKKFRIRFL